LIKIGSQWSIVEHFFVINNRSKKLNTVTLIEKNKIQIKDMKKDTVRRALQILEKKTNTTTKFFSNLSFIIISTN
jgi:hypothetical protein